MRVAKWGNSLAVRLPAKLVKELGVKDGDEVSIELEKAAGGKGWRAALAKLNALPKIIPAGYKFKREDAYEDE